MIHTHFPNRGAAAARSPLDRCVVPMSRIRLRGPAALTELGGKPPPTVAKLRKRVGRSSGLCLETVQRAAERVVVFAGEF